MKTSQYSSHYASLYPSHLSAHLMLCNRQRGAWFGWQCQADAAHSFFASRIVTCALATTLATYLLVQLLG
jgi:hypothetical protein